METEIVSKWDKNKGAFRFPLHIIEKGENL